MTAKLELCAVAELFRTAPRLFDVRERVIGEIEPVSQHLADFLHPLLNCGPLPAVGSQLYDTPGLRHYTEKVPSKDGCAVLLAGEAHLRVISSLGVSAHRY